MASWLTQDTPAGVQVMPIDDLILHTHSGCPCNPRVEQHGSTCWGEEHGPKLWVRTVTVHEAMDGRD